MLHVTAALEKDEEEGRGRWSGGRAVVRCRRRRWGDMEVVQATEVSAAKATADDGGDGV